MKRAPRTKKFEDNFATDFFGRILEPGDTIVWGCPLRKYVVLETKRKSVIVGTTEWSMRIKNSNNTVCLNKIQKEDYE